MMLLLLGCLVSLPEIQAPANPDGCRSEAATEEWCDGVDNDCDGLIDEDFDQDGDQFLADEAACRALGVLGDCDDRDAATFPGAAEACDGLDNNCDGIVDNPPDADADGFDPCSDCDEEDPSIFPGALEVCDGIDQDCDGIADEIFDEDGDGVASCDGDCDDQDAQNTPGLPERCDGRDNDCDDQIDEGWDIDADGYTFCEGDCEDANAAVHPGLSEICDGVDNDCNPSTSEDGDLDADGLSYCDGDCNDLAASAYPGATEVCDGVDNDCNGDSDELWECYDCTFQGTYAVCATSVSWSRASTVCGYRAGTLVVMDEATENENVSSYQYSLTGSAAWIGYTDARSEGNFEWIDGSLGGYANWYSGEPNDSGGVEDCAGTNFGAIAAWNDYDCDSLLPFICEF